LKVAFLLFGKIIMFDKKKYILAEKCVTILNVPFIFCPHLAKKV